MNLQILPQRYSLDPSKIETLVPPSFRQIETGRNNRGGSNTGSEWNYATARALQYHLGESEKHKTYEAEVVRVILALRLVEWRRRKRRAKKHQR